MEKLRSLPFLIVLALLASCGGPTTADLVITVTPEGDPSHPDALLVSHAGDRDWTDVRIVLGAAGDDGSVAPCGEQTLASWARGAEVRLPACGERTRLTIETRGASATYVFGGGRLFRRIGRKEIPIAG